MFLDDSVWIFFEFSISPRLLDPIPTITVHDIHEFFAFSIHLPFDLGGALIPADGHLMHITSLLEDHIIFIKFACNI